MLNFTKAKRAMNERECIICVWARGGGGGGGDCKASLRVRIEEKI